MLYGCYEEIAGRDEDGPVGGRRRRSMEDPDDDAPVNAVPLEVLQYVFSFLATEDLCAAAYVCRRWRYAFRCPSLWRHREVEVGAEPGSSKIGGAARLQMVLKTAPELGSLAIDNKAEYLPDCLLELQSPAVVCQRVRTLRLRSPDGRRFSATQRALLRRYSPSVETLEAAGGVRTEILHALAGAKRLRRLCLRGSIHGAVRLTDLRSAVGSCEAPLEHLDLAAVDLWGQDDEDAVSISALLLELVAAKCTTLLSLVLPPPYAVVTDSVLDQVVALCPRLETLGADFHDGPRMLRALSQLRSLRLWRGLRTPRKEDVEYLRQDGAEATAGLAGLERLSMNPGGLAENLTYAALLLTRIPGLRELHLVVDNSLLPTPLVLNLFTALKGTAVARLQLDCQSYTASDAELLLHRCLSPCSTEPWWQWHHGEPVKNGRMWTFYFTKYLESGRGSTVLEKR